jgi:hypothetical protein
MSKAPTFKDIFAIQLRARIRTRWQAMCSTKEVLDHATSHAYVLLAAAIGETLDEDLPVVAFASPISLQTAQQVDTSAPGVVLLAVLHHLGLIHKFAAELERLTNEHAEACTAYQELMLKKPDPRKHRGVAYAKQRSSQAYAGG